MKSAASGQDVWVNSLLAFSEQVVVSQCKHRREQCRNCMGCPVARCMLCVCRRMVGSAPGCWIAPCLMNEKKCTWFRGRVYDRSFGDILMRYVVFE
jgi:hypothetical protein